MLYRGGALQIVLIKFEITKHRAGVRGEAVHAAAARGGAVRDAHGDGCSGQPRHRRAQVSTNYNIIYGTYYMP